MKFRNKSGKHQEANYKHEHSDATDFHSKLMRQEIRFQNRKDESNNPEGNYEYEQMIAEDASFNTRKMISEAAYYISEHRGFMPGEEISDWLQAEKNVEFLLSNIQPFHLNPTSAVVSQTMI